MLIAAAAFLVGRAGPPQPVFETAQTRTGRPAQMLYRLERDAAVGGWTADGLRTAGDLWRELGDPARAHAYWRAAYAAAPDARLARTLAENALALRDWPTLADMTADVLAADPSDRWSSLHAGIVSAITGRPGAAAHLRSAADVAAFAPVATALVGVVERASASERALLAGLALADHGYWEQAELAFSLAAAEPALDATARGRAWALNGWARAHIGLNPDAARALAAALAPDDARVLLLDALTLRLLGQTERSLAALQAAVARAPDEPLFYAELGIGYTLLDDGERARHWLNRAADFAADAEQAARFRALAEAVLTTERDAERELLARFGLLAEATAQPPADATPEATPEAR
jgi:hypothetical protein